MIQSNELGGQIISDLIMKNGLSNTGKKWPLGFGSKHFSTKSGILYICYSEAGDNEIIDDKPHLTAKIVNDKLEVNVYNLPESFNLDQDDYVYWVNVMARTLHGPMSKAVVKLIEKYSECSKSEKESCA